MNRENIKYLIICISVYFKGFVLFIYKRYKKYIGESVKISKKIEKCGFEINYVNLNFKKMLLNIFVW